MVNNTPHISLFNQPLKHTSSCMYSCQSHQHQNCKSPWVCAGLFATQQAARAEGDAEAAEKTKIGQMFSSGSPLAPFVEPLTMYYQVSDCVIYGESAQRTSILLPSHMTWLHACECMLAVACYGRSCTCALESRHDLRQLHKHVLHP